MPKSAGNYNVEKLQTGEAKILIILVGINQDDDSRINNIEFGDDGNPHPRGLRLGIPRTCGTRGREGVRL